MSRRDNGPFAEPLTLVVVAAVCVVLFTVVVWVIRMWWELIVPDIFAGAVAAGLVPGSLTLGQAQKITYGLVVMAAAEFAGGLFKKAREVARE